ncbi:MAG TPA: hypothetical protein VF748_15095 [Candidatus Acidoferrum sp.]
MAEKQYWWISVEGGDCEPAVLVGKTIHTLGCPDPLDADQIVLVKRMDVPLSPRQEAQRRIEWDARPHGYRRF